MNICNIEIEKEMIRNAEREKIRKYEKETKGFIPGVNVSLIRVRDLPMDLHTDSDHRDS